ncbi:hypothetical protein Pyn_37069 [Prunus yedoensis var. nudiflora]|uniref:Uncharacterized protein n=1 Tax=Prunus yedoensis var. nudiflora TaxID=2094558 RepID=A0A314YFA6_PRUYE|nr:hypothetical protein Pyn_37069 [Prunus yedoensis var. nudiflora]
MANIVTFLCLYILSSTLLLSRITMANPGLSIKLIHRDSPESPLYQPNLTQSHRTQKLILSYPKLTPCA